MHSRILSAFLLVALLSGGAVAGDGFDAAAAANAFGLDLYLRLGAGGGNLFFSPASVAYALSMTRLGARGRTADEMDRVLHLPGDAAAVADGFGGLMTTLTSDRGSSTLDLANRLYGQRGFGFDRAYLDRLDRSYGAGMELVDFRRDPEAARRAINAWVAGRTADKIPELLDAGAVDASTRLVLVNAVYFLGRWANAFPVEGTSDAPFHREKGGDVSVPFMHVSERFGYAEVDDARILALPYAEGDLQMLLVLPDEETTLAELESHLDYDRFAAWLAAPRPRPVDVALPRVHLETGFELAPQLAALGMPTAFTAQADFSGMAAGGESLAIDQVVHKAYLDVDEKGTEAAAATGVVMKVTSALPVEKPVVFVADRPFLLAIRDTRSGTVLFLGRVADPS